MNRMIQKLAFLFVVLMNTFGMRANPVDMWTACEVAVKYMNTNAKTPFLGVEDLQLVKTYSIDRGDVAFYIFNAPNGFVIVSADDCASPILGYSNEGQFDVENVPIQLLDYLQDFVEQIQYGIESHLEADEATMRQWEAVRKGGHLKEQRTTSSVEPLITSNWGQGCYFNSYCPVDSIGLCNHVLVGCVAVSFAQIMHFWGYPSIGTGSHTYTPVDYPTQTANFGATIYDWANMPNALSDTATSTEIDAVATLLWHCGVAADMIYGPNASSSDIVYVVSSLVDYFGYSDELSLVFRINYNDEEWLTMMKNCLELGRPILYSGGGSLGSHAFVCDGYDANDLLHFNWGWNGNYNGYYALSALNPDIYTFNSGNKAIINIHPKCTAGSTYQVTASVSPADEGLVYGMGYYDCNTVCTLMATPADGNVFCSWTENDMIVSVEPTYSFNVTRDRNLVANFAEEGSLCNLVFDFYDSYGDGWTGNYLVIDYGNGITEQLSMDGGSSTSYSREIMSGSLVTLSWVSGAYSSDCSFDITYENGDTIYHGEDLTSDFQHEFIIECDVGYPTYVISLIAIPEEGGTVTGGGYYEDGATCSLNATANMGYVFVNWMKDGEEVSNDETYSFVVTGDALFVAHFEQVQTIELTAGPNWFSTYLDITLDDLKAALVAAVPANTTITIKNATQNTLYSRGQWNGALDWDVAKMYKIIVPTACEMTLEGMPLNPAEHAITIVGGGVPTWIGFPFSESMTLTNAFAGFAQDGDIVKSSSDNAQYARGLWNGQVTVLEPGKGYLYISAPTMADRILTFPISAK